MPTYIVLANWTEKGFQELKESPQRLDEFKELCAQMGGRLVAFYMTMGPYDMAIIVEAPDDAALARLALMGGKQGAIHTLTLKAFTEDKYVEIVRSLA